MANRITDECIGCGNCEIACIYGAISASGDAYAIDPTRCDGCATLPCGCRCVKICPVGAIVRGPAILRASEWRTVASARLGARV